MSLHNIRRYMFMRKVNAKKLIPRNEPLFHDYLYIICNVEREKISRNIGAEPQTMKD